MQYNQQSSAGRLQMLPQCDARDWLAETDQVLGSLTMYAAEHHDAKLVLDSGTQNE